MNVPAIARIPLVAMLMAACSMAPAAQPTPSASPPATPTPSTATTPSATPGSTATPEPKPTATGTEPRTPRPFFEPAEGSKPPKATLSVGTVSVEASPIGYCWDDECIDGPNPPKDQLPELELSDSNIELNFEVGGGARFARWGAEYYDRSDDNAVSLGGGGFTYDPDVTPATPWAEMSIATFPAPPPGDWVVNVYLELVHGDLSYGWHVIVP